MKNKVILFGLIGTMIVGGGSNIAAKDIGQNLSKGSVVSKYNADSGELTLYGKNSNGNLGTGNNAAVTKEKAIKINSKVGNKKITDYLVTKDATYVLTSNGKVYATGKNIPDNMKGKRNTFIDIVFYKSYSIKDIKGNVNGEVKYGTSNSKIKYTSDSSITERKYVIYNSKMNGNIHNVIINRKHKFIKTFLTETKKKKTTITEYNGKGEKKFRTIHGKKKKNIYIYTYKYSKNKVVEKNVNVDSGKTGKNELTKYKKGKKTYKVITKFEFRKNRLKNKDGITAKTKYYYKNGKLSVRKTYKVNKNKKLVLVNTKKYSKKKQDNLTEKKDNAIK